MPETGNWSDDPLTSDAGVGGERPRQLTGSCSFPFDHIDLFCICSALAACFVVVSDIFGSIMEKDVPLTFVLLFPYAYQNSKTVEFVAKHGSLLFVVIFSFFTIWCYLNNTINLCVLFLSQAVFYSSTYIIGSFTDNKAFQCVQILATCIFIPYSCSLTNFVTHKLLFIKCLSLFTFFLTCIYPIFLHLVYRKHYVKDLSTPQSVSRLNFVDFCTFLLLTVCFCSAVPLPELLIMYFPCGFNRTFYRQLSIPYLFLLSLVCLYLVGFVVACYYYVISSNRSKRMTTSCMVLFDHYDRAWCTVIPYNIDLELSEDFGCCAKLVCNSCCTSSNQSRVKPLEA